MAWRVGCFRVAVDVEGKWPVLNPDRPFSLCACALRRNASRAPWRNQRGKRAVNQSAQALQYPLGIDQLVLVPLQVGRKHALFIANPVLLTLEIPVQSLVVFILSARTQTLLEFVLISPEMLFQ